MAPIWLHPHSLRQILGLKCERYAGYGEPGFLASYLGVQAHGILWPAPGAPKSTNWPIAPPTVSAKVCT